MLRFVCLLFIGMLVNSSSYAQDINPFLPPAYSTAAPLNYIRSWDVLKPVTNPDDVLTLDPRDRRQKTEYIDAQGRSFQTVLKQGAMATNAVATDLVYPIAYDEYGRTNRNFLPFAASDGLGTFKLNAFQQQQAFYQNLNDAAGETFYYGKTEFEASPLNRPLRTYAPGNSWVNLGKGTEYQYLTNTIIDEVHKWTVSPVNNAFSTFSTSSSAIYPAGELFKNVSVDEAGKQVIEFKDKEGQVILKKLQLSATSDNGAGSSHIGWLCTYYIYNDLTQLIAVIQPYGTERLAVNSWNINAESGSILLQQCFRYQYDIRNRLIRKKAPGFVENRMVYDARDRLVMTQDRRQNAAKLWLYTKYDELNRPIETGSFKDDTYYNDFQHHLDLSSISTSYPNVSPESTPFTEVTVLSQTFYDNYSWRASEGNPLTETFQSPASGLMAASSAFPYPETPAKSNATFGLVTGTKMKIYNATSDYTYNVNIYDEKGRLVQVQTSYKSGSTVTSSSINTTQYSFTGQPLVTIQQTIKNGTNPQTHTIVTTLAYDDLWRLLTVRKSVNSVLPGSVTVSKPDQLIVTNEYDELGKLKKKSLGNGTLENPEYSYNIRGWLTGINKNDLNGSAHAFDMELGYDKTTSQATGTSYLNAQYNGNISGTVWKSKGDGIARKYDFTYDPANRLTGANFLQNDAGNWTIDLVDFTVSNLTYDANGNIQTMKQKGIRPNATAPLLVDDLKYNYIYNSNQLRNVIDAQNDPLTNMGDFRASTKYTAALAPNITVQYPTGKTPATDDYLYDATGNVARDLNKDISSIGYNHLNQPTYISFLKPNGDSKGTIQYYYDAGGNKVKKVVSEVGSPVKTTLYLNGMVFENDVLQFISQEEGRIRFTPSIGSTSAKFDYDYFLKDHLGNVRMVLTDEQQQVVYPAATLEGSYSTTGSPNAVNIEKDYYSIVEGNIVSKPLGMPDYANNNGAPPYNNNPSSVTTANSQKVYQLQATGTKAAIGLGTTLKVMSGDVINIFGKSYYQVDNTNGTNQNVPVNDLLLNLLGGSSGVGAGKGLSATSLNDIPAVTSAIGAFLTNTDRETGSSPKAYINYILLDEQFRYVSGGYSRVGAINALKDHAADLQNISVNKNGYIYIYCSNESPVQVFFDNLQVIHTKGSLLEDTHYYPFGLTMAGISSKAIGKLENKYKYNKGSELQSKEFSDGYGLDLYATYFRSLDPQLGRWWQVDPKPESALEVSPYASMNNNPINVIDPLGDVVKYERGEGVTRKEFRQFKREIRQMSRNSESFGKIFKGFKKDSRTFKYVATNTSSGGVTKPTEKGYDMNISIHGKDANQGGDERASTIGQIAHETGHAFRKSNNLDLQGPDKMPSLFGMKSIEMIKALNNYADQMVNANNTSELGASHIENIVLGELINKGFYSNLQISAIYFGGAASEYGLIPSLPGAKGLVPADLDKLAPPRTKEYYLNTHFNIYKEHGLQEP